MSLHEIILKKVAYLGGQMGYGPPWAKTINFEHRRKYFGPLCVSTSGRRKFGPLYGILYTPLIEIL